MAGVEGRSVCEPEFNPSFAVPSQWSCCGAHGPDDWNLNMYFNCTNSNPSRERCGVPFSCCVKDPAVSRPLPLFEMLNRVSFPLIYCSVQIKDTVKGIYLFILQTHSSPFSLSKHLI